MMKSHAGMASVFFVLGLILASSAAGGETERPLPAPKPAVSTRTDDIIYGRKYGMALTMNLLKPAKPNHRQARVRAQLARHRKGLPIDRRLVR